MFMNYNKASNPVERMLMVMQESAYSFFLTGSRWFGDSKPDSDWDFFAPYASQDNGVRIEDWLKQKGFALHNGEYTDSSVRAVYRFTPPMFFGDFNERTNAVSIDVQLVENTSVKQMAQEILATPLLHVGFKAASKGGKAQYWEQALTTARRINSL